MSPSANLSDNRLDASVSLALLADVLPELDVARMPTTSSWRIAWCHPAFDDDSQITSAFPAESILYVTDRADLEAVREHAESVVAFIMKDPAEAKKLLAAGGTKERERMLVLVQSENPLPLVIILSRIQLRLQHSKSWCAALEEAMRQDNSMQRLLDLGEEQFGNFMHVSDASYALIGFTTHINPLGSLNTALVELGHHDAETVANALKSGVFEQWDKQRGVKVFEPTEKIPCPFMTYVMKRFGQYCGHVVMICNNASPNPWQEALFEQFALACASVASRDFTGGPEIKPQLFRFLVRLMTDSRCSQEYIDGQSSMTGVPRDGSFRLMMVDAGGTSFESQLPFLASSLARVFPSAYIYGYDQSVLLLTHYPEFDAGRIRSEYKLLDSFCKSHECLAYLSDPFERIRDIRPAYLQLRATADHRRSIDIWKRPFDDIDTRRVFPFDEAFSFVLLENSYDPEFKQYCLNHSALRLLEPSRTSDNVDELRFVHCYLLNERHATPTAQQLGMHRNSVVYRANSLKNRFGIDLDQSAVRERLSICIKMRIASDPVFADQLAGN